MGETLHQHTLFLLPGHTSLSPETPAWPVPLRCAGRWSQQSLAASVLCLCLPGVRTQPCTALCAGVACQGWASCWRPWLPDGVWCQQWAAYACSVCSYFGSLVSTALPDWSLCVCVKISDQWLWNSSGAILSTWRWV